MARYCFYCGRQLNSGERCNCSVAQQKRAESDSVHSTSPDSNKTTATENNTANETSSKDNKDGRKSRAHKAQAKAEARKAEKAKKTRIKQERASAKRHSYDNARWHEALFSFGRNMILAIRKPTAFIQDASHPSLTTALITQTFECLLMTFVLIRMLIASNIGNLLSYGNSEMTRNLTSGSRVLFFFRIFLIALVLWAIRTVVSNLVTRFVGRVKMPMQETGKLMTAGSIYFSFFLIIGLILSSGSGLQTLLVLTAGYSVKVMIDHFAIRMHTGLSEDTMIRISLINFLVLALVFGSVIGILTPNISEFRASVAGELT